mmetsp:Transcript_32843/g.97544  ORF Transcript_32843/g.97544 Transcript_32843/m.97544 type:complete len:253 (-) Transcript_32843:578-1336(-)
MISESNLARQPGEQQQQPERGETPIETRAWAVDPFAAPVQDMMSAPLPLAAPVQRLRGGLFDGWPEDALLERSLGLGFQGFLGDLLGSTRSSSAPPRAAWPTSRGLGSFSCQETASMTRRGPDGKVHTERFASSAVGDVPTRAQEVQQAYANSLTGTEKASLERQLEGRGFKAVDERNRLSGERRRTDRYLGNLEEQQTADFEQQWQARAVPALPRHLGGGARQLLSGACAPLELSSGAPRADAAPAAISAQ